MRRNAHTCRPRRSGFVLLMTLVLVLLAGVSLAGVARRSALGAVETRTGVEALQRRWAITSLHATLAGRAEALLDEAEQRAHRSVAHERRPIASGRVVFELAGHAYELVVTDEQSKLNVNQLVASEGRAAAQEAVGRLVGAGRAPDSKVKVSLRQRSSSVAGSVDGSTLPAVVGYGQLFEAVPPDALIGDGAGSGLAAGVTLWGDGRVNVRRASDEVIRRACTKPLGPVVVAKLIAARNENPKRDLADLLKGISGLDRALRVKIDRHVTDRSRCHGLWVIARDGQRAWHSLLIVEGEPNDLQEHRYTW